MSTRVSDVELASAMQNHLVWLLSGGSQGTQLDLSHRRMTLF